MARYLLCATPAGGHVRPVLPVASGLVARGHEVTVLTGSRFGSVVEAAGIAFRTLTGSADIDDRNPDSFLPDRHRYKGLRLARYQLRRMFVDPVPVQYHDVTVALRATDADAVVVDAMLLGVLRFWTSRRAYRSSRWESHRCHYRARTFRSPCRRTSSATLLFPAAEGANKQRPGSVATQDNG